MCLHIDLVSWAFFIVLRAAAGLRAYFSPDPRQRSTGGQADGQQVFGLEPGRPPPGKKAARVPQPWRFWIRIIFSCVGSSGEK